MKKNLKKLTAMLLLAVFAVSFAACGGAAAPADDVQQGTEYADALELMTAIWDAFPEDERFACFGGGQGDTLVSDAPGALDTGDTDTMSYTLLIPEELQSKTVSAASLVHMMNANTFTGAVLQLNGADTADAAKAIEQAVTGNHFMCGFPDKLVVLGLGDYVIYAFGSEQLVDGFRDAASGSLSGTVETLYDEPIV